MKKVIYFVICIVMLLSLSACNKNSNSIEHPVSFYYRNAIVYYNSEDAVIAPETRDSAGYNPTGIMNLYLSGPLSPDLQSPFPAGVSVHYIVQNNDCLYIGLSQSFDELSSMEQTIAYACLFKTLAGLTQCSTVEISFKDAASNANNYIVIDQDSLIFMDNINPY